MQTTNASYIVVPAPGYYGDRATVLSAHATLDAAKRAAKRHGASACVREGSAGTSRKGATWLRAYEATSPRLG